MKAAKAAYSYGEASPGWCFRFFVFSFFLFSFFPFALIFGAPLTRMDADQDRRERPVSITSHKSIEMRV